MTKESNTWKSALAMCKTAAPFVHFKRRMAGIQTAVCKVSHGMVHPLIASKETPNAAERTSVYSGLE